MGDASNEVRRVSIGRAILRIHLVVMREQIRALQTETDGRRILLWLRCSEWIADVLVEPNYHQEVTSRESSRYSQLACSDSCCRSPRPKTRLSNSTVESP